MILEKGNQKRLAIYFFFDAQGIVDRFVTYFLEDLKKNVSDIFIVCNGKLTDEGREMLEPYGEVCVRENKGFDVWAYKEGISHYGWEKLESYDEVIMLNSTIMGPVYPLEETFAKMDAEDVDFWGMTEFFRFPTDPSGRCRYGYIPDHIQSHFIACRRSLVKSAAFHEYWDEMPMIHDYWDAVGRHEMVFTKHFADLGFRWKTSVEMDDLRAMNGYPMMMCPRKLVEERRCPIFKRKSFFNDPKDYVSNTAGEAVQELYTFLRDHTDYDVDFIWEAILRNFNQADIVKDMNLHYVLSTKLMDQSQLAREVRGNKIALVMHLYFEDLLEESLHYAEAMPEEADVYITTGSEEMKAAIEKVFAGLRCRRLTVRVITNRGRDVSSILVGVKDVIMDYDIVCFTHDKKTTQVNPGTAGAGFCYKCFENILAGKAFVANVIHTFAENPRLGLLSPPEPNHGPFYPTLGKEWRSNYETTKALAGELGIHVPIDAAKAPVAPYGSVFWFRPRAMKSLYAKDWQYEDFPEEPLAIEGTISHAIERIRPYAVQQEGYYPAVVMSDKCAAVEYGNLHHYVRGFNRSLMDCGMESYFHEMNRMMDEALSDLDGRPSIKAAVRHSAKTILKRALPGKFYESAKRLVKRG